MNTQGVFEPVGFFLSIWNISVVEMLYPPEKGTDVKGYNIC